MIVSEKNYTVYILECDDGTYYVGSTNDLKKRFAEHNNSKRGAKYTKMRRPVVIKYLETYATLLEARGREAAIKRWRRKRKESLWVTDTGS